ncbi:MAG: outer membrane protein assembly factor BamB [Gammaproteobacteria bacterium]|nr:outer membrane protein assembly factor BamB [Gammaproteobacteria bacterium]
MRYWLLILLIPFALAACSNDDDEVIPPSPLPVFKSDVQVKKLWTQNVGDGVDDVYLNLKPAVTERWVFAAAISGELVKIDRATGDVVWEVETERTITGGVSAAYGVVAFGTGDGEVVVLNEEDGAILWSKKLDGQIMAAPAIAADHILVQTLSGRLHGLKREDGAVAWLYDTSIPILTLRGESSPVVVGEVTLAGFANGKLAALDTNTGFVGWERSIGQSEGRSELERLIDLDGRFWVSGKTVYAVTYQGNASAIDIPSGRLLWTRKMSSYSGVSEFLSQLYVVDDDGKLAALDAVSGTDLWLQEGLRGRRLSAPTAYDRYVVVGDFAGYLHWLSYQDGSFKARVKVSSRPTRNPNAKLGQAEPKRTEDGLRAEPVVYQDIVYVQGNGGAVAAYQVIEKK